MKNPSAPLEVREAVSVLIAKVGLGGASAFLGMSDESVLRLKDGQPVRKMTISLARMKLGLPDPEDGDAG